MSTPDKPGSRALDAIDALLAEAGLSPKPASALDGDRIRRPHLGCDLCGAIELCPPCTPKLA